MQPSEYTPMCVISKGDPERPDLEGVARPRSNA
jgi:hypothetical protein